VSRGDCLGFKKSFRKSEETDPRVLSLNESLVLLHRGDAHISLLDHTVSMGIGEIAGDNP
jgi:hypothetical protein